MMYNFIVTYIHIKICNISSWIQVIFSFHIFIFWGNTYFLSQIIMQQYCDHCNECSAVSVCCACGEPLIYDDEDDSGYTSDDVSDDEIDNVYPL